MKSIYVYYTSQDRIHQEDENLAVVLVANTDHVLKYDEIQ